MKDFKNKRKDKEVTEDVKKEGIKQKEKKGKLGELRLRIFIAVLGFLLGMATEIVIEIYQSIEESSEQEVSNAINDQSAEENPEQEVSDIYNTYDWGVLQMKHLLSLQEDVIAFYKSDDITDEQMKEFVEAYLNIIDVSLRNDDITPEAINNYNEIIKEINLIDYDDTYKLRSTGAEYRRGLKGYLVANSCWQIVEYYRELIPEEKYESFVKIASVNLNIVTECENNTQIVIEHGRDLIQEYIGDPDEVLVSTEWRVMLEK